jgi:RsiW-degrading membrane proteinase PrsW (M82 family)
MAEQVLVLPPGVALAIIAFLLALLPAALFIWFWYLRRTDRQVPGSMIAWGWIVGLILVWPAFQLEHGARWLWSVLSPGTVHYFLGAVLPLQGWVDIVAPAIGTFLIVALVEEGLRYAVLRWWITRSARVDQVFDGLVLGVALGLGFATLENTLYFWELFRQESFDTLVFVFFLRFLISTVAHVSFGGLMGVFLARGVLGWDNPKREFWRALWMPWLIHGSYDLLLGLNLTFHAVLLIVPPLILLMVWSGRRDFFTVNRKNGKILVMGEAPERRQDEIVKRLFKQLDSPWNKYAPWLGLRAYRGTLLRQLLNK